MRQVIAWLDGKKSYLGVIAMGILGLLWNQGLIDDKLAFGIGTLVSTVTGIAFRAGIKKSGE